MKIKSKLITKGNAGKFIKQLTKSFKDIEILVGVPKDAAPYPDGTSTAMVGAVHEFGSPENNIPERSFLRTSIAKNQDKYVGLAVKGIKKVVQKKMTIEKVAGLIGLQAEEDVKQEITELKEPPLKPQTIKARKDQSSNPLVDTGHLRQSIRFEVRRK